MKKHDEGYVLVYVTVVLLVFCLVAATILTGALHNLNNQQNAIAKMEDQYAAEGMIEQVIAQWKSIDWDAYTAEETPVGETGVLYMGTTEDDVIILSATYGTVSIICELDKNGQYLSYEIGTFVPTEPKEVQP